MSGRRQEIDLPPERRRLAARLQDLQAATGKSLKDLERLVHASDSSLSRYLSGRTVPPWGTYSAGVRAGGNQAPVVKSLWIASSLSSPHLVAVSR